MSIRFGWTRPQAGPETTDDEHVEDVSSVPADLAANSTVLPGAATRVPATTRLAEENVPSDTSATPRLRQVPQ